MTETPPEQETRPVQMLSAIMIIPPPHVQRVALPIARQYARRSLKYYPPHITVLFPFAPHGQLRGACGALRAVCAEIRPFEITLSGYDMFPGVAYMKPRNEAQIVAVLRRVHAIFPEYPPYGGLHGDDLQPHLTVGLFESEEEQLTASLPAYEPLTFTVDRFHVLYGEHSGEPGPWVTDDIIPLGG